MQDADSGCMDVPRQSQLGFDPTSGKDLTGYHVEALDGSIGKMDEATYDVAQSYRDRRHGALDLRQESDAPSRASSSGSTRTRRRSL